MRAEGLKSLYCILKTPTAAERETGSFSSSSTVKD
jgi:hypothetical protein